MICREKKPKGVFYGGFELLMVTREGVYDITFNARARYKR